jgi:hypothetical protein
VKWLLKQFNSKQVKLLKIDFQKNVKRTHFSGVRSVCHLAVLFAVAKTAGERRGGKGPNSLPEERSSRKGTLHHITTVTTSPSLHSQQSPLNKQRTHGGL